MKTIIHACLGFIVLFLGLSLVQGCDKPDPNVSTPTSGKLLVYADEAYAPLVRELADTFMVRCPDAKIQIRSLNARAAVQSLLDAQSQRPRMGTDTATTTAIVIGRTLLPDERDLVKKAGLEISEYALATDGLAVAVPMASALDETMVEFLQNTLRTPAPTESMLNRKAPDKPLRFLFTDQNSSAYSVMRSQLTHDSDVKAASTYYGASDSVLDRVAAGQGISVIGWYPAHRDSIRVRTLRLGFTDSTKKYQPPVRVHPASLVTGAYPLRQPLAGYTFAVTNSLASGFLAWLSSSQDAQYFLAHQGLLPANVKLRLITPDE